MKEADDIPKTESSAEGGPPRPPKKTLAGFDGEDDDLRELLRSLDPEERSELAEWLRTYFGDTGEQAV